MIRKRIYIERDSIVLTKNKVKKFFHFFTSVLNEQKTPKTSVDSKPNSINSTVLRRIYQGDLLYK